MNIDPVLLPLALFMLALLVAWAVQTLWDEWDALPAWIGPVVMLAFAGLVIWLARLVGGR